MRYIFRFFMRQRAECSIFTRNYKTLKIGDISKQIVQPKCPEFVPRGYAKPPLPQQDLQILKWLLQKERLKQDVFLIGVPGARRRQIVLAYLELTESEYEYLALTRDVTESDIKQRREIKSGSAFYVDQCAVRAAVEGRTLILDGIEKAERNVLPILNNLLENREMQLDDGRFLVAPEKFDKLLKEKSREELEKMDLLRVSEKFRVIALGLPVPKFRGHTLDPPLRSRFQAKNVAFPSFKDFCDNLRTLAPNVDYRQLSQLTAFGYSLLAEESAELALPEFPVENLTLAAQIWNMNSNFSAEQILNLLYPFSSFLKKDAIENLQIAMKNFEMETKNSNKFVNASLKNVAHTGGEFGEAVVDMSWNNKRVSFEVPSGNGIDKRSSGYVSNKSHDQLLCEMMLTHSVGDFCLIGPKGCGKSMLINKLAEALGYNLIHIALYQDMTSRDLLQQRRMLPNGDTIWRHSPLVDACLSGGLAVLDGIHRVHHSTLNVLQRLVHDREVELFDGTRLMHKNRYERLKADTSVSDEDLRKRKIFPIHQSFRIIALADPPNLHDSSQQWLTPELLSLFLYHQVRPLSSKEETSVIEKLVPNISDTIVRSLLNFVEGLRNSQDTNLQGLAGSLSTRQLVRIMKRISQYQEENLNLAIKKACLSRFLPQFTKVALNQSLEASGILLPKIPSSSNKAVEIRNGEIKIGDTVAPIKKDSNAALVPDVLFYDTAEHLQILEDMLRDFLLGEHLLLIGNQGVGKNKIADRFLQLLNKPRQYIQLHRDTTVQTLTLQSTVVDGVVTYDDSPLVKAVKHGHILVIDEGDKAPTHVTCILKSLLESNEMRLADGRFIRPKPTDGETVNNENVVFVHPEFRVIVLANRPGFPFLGNDFYSSLGDLFACHVVDNPSMQSELSMLKKYAPEVPQQTLERLTRAFSELRSMADEGLLNYPYSTRELVNIAKHMQEFGNDSAAAVVRNVFDFDTYDKTVEDMVFEVFAKHGFPFARHQQKMEIKLAPRFDIKPAKSIGTWGVSDSTSPIKLEVNRGEMQLKGPSSLHVSSYHSDRVDARSLNFSEQQTFFQLPIMETNLVSDVASNDSGDIFTATVNPVSVYCLKPSEGRGIVVDLYNYFPNVRRISKWRSKLAAFNSKSAFNNWVLLHEETTNKLLMIDFGTQQAYSVNSSSEWFYEKHVEMAANVVKGVGIATNEAFHRLIPCFDGDKHKAVVFEKYGHQLSIMDFDQGSIIKIELPDAMEACHIVTDRILLIQTSENKFKKLEILDDGEALLYDIDSQQQWRIGDTGTVAGKDMHRLLLQQCLNMEIASPNRLMSTSGVNNFDSYGAISVGFPELPASGEIYIFPREKEELIHLVQPQWAPNSCLKFVHPYSKTLVLPHMGQVINALPIWKIPLKVVENRDINVGHIGGLLEVADLASKSVSYIPVPTPKFTQSNTSWQCTLMEAMFTMAPYGAEGVVTADSAGGLRLWETSMVGLQNSINAWAKAIGADGGDLQITIEKDSGDLSKLTDPKHGMIDPTGDPHVGGNTFAGGSGGYSTAGMGGVGGPYRLDIGQTVFQLPESVKEQVPEEIRKKAREMSKKAYKQRLKEIQMSEFDADMYEKFRLRVNKQITQLRAVIDSLHAKAKERQWEKHQTSGDFDEGKLIEGMTGEKTVYRRRTEREPEPGSPQQKPKRLRFCVDVSGSMYRFNGYDGRLQRSLEACLMMIEALKGHEHRFRYDVVGHSGEEPAVMFVDADKPPKNEKERLDVLKMMMAHSQYCISGDNTLESTQQAVRELAKEDADEHLVVVLSDANFDRYGISPAQFAKVMTSDDRVNVFAVFIGSLGDQAERLKKKLPLSKAFICRDTADLPQILQNIFNSTIAGGS